MHSAWYHDLAAWLLDVILWIPRYLFALFADFVVWALSWIETALAGVTALYQSYWAPVMAGPVGYWADVTNIAFGITAIFGAYIVRFLVRRLPVVG